MAWRQALTQGLGRARRLRAKARLWPGRESWNVNSFSSLSQAEYSRLNLASDGVGYNKVLNEVKKRRPFLLRDVYDDMLLDGVQPEFLTFHVLITGAADGNKLQDAVHFFDELKGMGFTPNHVLYNSLISACGRNQQLSRAFQLVAEMETYGMQPKYPTFVALLNACGTAGSSEEAEEVVRRMAAAGLTLDQYGYSALMMVEKNKRPVTAATFDKIFELLEQSKAQAKTPFQPASAIDDELAAAVTGNRHARSHVAHCTAVVACAELGNEQAMTKAVQILEEDGYQMDELTLTHIVKCFIELGEFHKAMAVFERLLRSGRTQVMDTYLIMIEGLLSRTTPSNVADAKRLLSEFDSRGFFLNARSGSNLLLRACVVPGDLTVAILIWDMMVKRNMRPHARACRAFASALKSCQIPSTDPRMSKALEYAMPRFQWRAGPTEVNGRRFTDS